MDKRWAKSWVSRFWRYISSTYSSNRWQRISTFRV